MDYRKLKLTFSIFAPLFILFIIIITNIRTNNYTTDNNNLYTTPTIIAPTNPAEGQIIAIFTSYNTTNSELLAYIYDTAADDCLDTDGYCFGIKLVNKRSIKFKVSNNTVFNINKKSINECVTNEINPELVSISLNEFLNGNCNYFDTGQLFIVLNNSIDDPEFIEYTFAYKFN